MVEQLKELYNNATNQFQIYTYSNNKDECMESMRKVASAGFTNPNSVALSVRIDGNLGFVVSNNQNVTLEYEGKKVIKLSQITVETDKVGILVGIHPNIKTEIIMSLEENRIRNYYWPSI